MLRIRNLASLLLLFSASNANALSNKNSLYKRQNGDDFDYIIVGAGPAGLVLANRLSKDPSVSVAVIEAGDSVYDNPNVTSVLAFGSAMGTDIDYSYPSAPQKYAGDRPLVYSAGKALGGTSTINGMTYIRAEKAQIDAWETELGNEGWGWDGLWPYYLKQEGFQVPSQAEKSKGASFVEDFHRTQGEVGTGWNKYLTGQNISRILRDTSERLGIPFNEDPNGGYMRGYSAWPMTAFDGNDDQEEPVRADAARAYYFPVKDDRDNLVVFLNTTATNIVWDEEKLAGGEVVAKGVEITASKSNETQILYAKDEVILSAGSIRSPALLEHSGVGNPTVLEPLGIKTILDLPGVGANLQDQPNLLMSWNSTTNWTGYPNFVTYLTALDIFGDDVESVGELVRSNISAYAERIVADLPANDTTKEIQQQLLTVQANLIFSRNSTVPLVEMVWFPLATTVVSAFWNLLPFSRGSIHINSSNPLDAPSINANFWQAETDIYIQTIASRRLRQYFGTPPLSSLVTEEVAPGFDTVPRRSPTRAQWESWIKSSYNTNNHPVGTTAMMKRELGGVVDAEAKVYGTQNLRVVDGGVLPMQVSGHLVSNIYAVAEKVAEGIVKGRETR